MLRPFLPIVPVLSLFLLLPGATPAASQDLFRGDVLDRRSARQEAARLSADGLILHGSVADPVLGKDGEGRTDFLVKRTLRRGKTPPPAKLVLPRYLKVKDAKDPPHYLVICEPIKGGFDAHWGRPLLGVRSLPYFEKGVTLDAKKPTDNLAFFFPHLRDPDPTVAFDAFLEFQAAHPAEVLSAGPRFDAAKLRGWLKDPKTPPEQRSLSAALLGTCGDATADRKLLVGLLEGKDSDPRVFEGALLGLVWLNPKAGWPRLQAMSEGRKKPAALGQLPALRAAMNAHRARPKDARPHVARAVKALLDDPGMWGRTLQALREAKFWDLTDEVVKYYDRKNYDNDVARLALLRYVVSCPPTKAAADFLAARRADSRGAVEAAEALNKAEGAGKMRGEK